MHLFHCPNMVPVAGVEPARVISPTDFESASSANSNTPAYVGTLLVYQPHAKLSRHPRRDFADKFSDFFVKRH